MNGLLAGFATAPDLKRALEHLRAARIDAETYAPAPPEATKSNDVVVVSPATPSAQALPSASAAPGRSSVSPLPLIMFIAGMAGFVGFFALMTYANVVDYPLDIGGRPKFAWPTFVPIAFELGVLCAMVAGFVGFFVICRLPQLYDPIDECDALRGASRGAWFVAIRSDDAERAAHARAILEALHPASLDEFDA